MKYKETRKPMLNIWERSFPICERESNFIYEKNQQPNSKNYPLL